MAQFFINRPIFAWVIALFIIVMGSVPVTAQGTYGAIDAGSYTYADHPAFALSGIDPGIVRAGGVRCGVKRSRNSTVPAGHSG